MGDKKQFFLNFITTFISTAIGVGISFILTPFIVKRLGADAYGFFPLSNNFLSYVTIITAAINSQSSRFITIELERKNIQKANIYFNSVFVANLIMSLFFFVLAALFVIFIDQFLKIPGRLVFDVRMLFAFTFSSMLIGLTNSVFSVCTFAVNRQDMEAYRTIISNVLRICLIFGLFYFFTPKLYFLGISSIVSAIYLAIANRYLTKKFLPQMKISLAAFNRKAIKEITASGVWNSINSLSVVLMTQVDLFLANIFTTPHDMGIFSLSKVVPNFMEVLIGVVSTVFVPKLVVLYGRNDKEGLLKEIGFSIKILSIVVVIPICFLFVYGDVFMNLWVPGQNVELLHRLSNMALFRIFAYGIVATIYPIYSVVNKLRVPAIVWLIAGIVEVSTIIILFRTTHLGIFTIPIVSMTTAFLRNFLFTPYYAAKCLNIKTNTFYINLLKNILYAVIILLILFGIRPLVIGQIHTWSTFLSFCIIGGAILVALMSIVLLTKEQKKTILLKVSLKINKIRNQ